MSEVFQNYRSKTSNQKIKFLVIRCCLKVNRCCLLRKLSKRSAKMMTCAAYVQKLSCLLMHVLHNLWKKCLISNLTFPKRFPKNISKIVSKKMFPKCSMFPKWPQKKFGLSNSQLNSSYSWLEVLKQFVIYAHALQPILKKDF